MKQKLLIVLLLSCAAFVNAQEFYDSLVFTELRIDRTENFYLELTNMGSKDVQMSEYKLGIIYANQLAYNTFPEQTLFFPEYILKPGESYVLAQVFDVNLRNWLKEPHREELMNKGDFWDLANFQFHKLEDGSPGDSVPVPYAIFRNMVFEGETMFLEHHVNGDSLVVDQVGGVFDGADGKNLAVAYDVAGYPKATRETILIRKFRVKKGNLDFNTTRGIDPTDSDWITIPFSYIRDLREDWINNESYRRAFWTVGNHGDYNLNETTLVSDKAVVDLNAKTITVPWGARRLDNFMNLFEKKPGIAWRYHLSANPGDSVYNSARNGDRITLYVCGDDVDADTFNIIVNDPTEDANMVVPKYKPQVSGYFTSVILSGNAEVFNVTEGEPGMDTIYDAGIAGTLRTTLVGIEYATHVDSFFKYLEKPSNANWEIDWVDDTERTFLKNGDLLKVTSQNGNVKNYFIKVYQYYPGKDATLSSITWPDIPEYYKGVFGWKGDTIPDFSGQVFNYNVMVPLDVIGIPALVGKTSDLNAKVQVQKAKSLSGTLEDRTITFTVTAEDGVTVNVYRITLVKEKDPDKIQPLIAEPFISEYSHRVQFGNGFIEICNPGTEVLDLSNYMIVRASGASNPATALQEYTANTGQGWMRRFMKYAPGYKWVDSLTWTITPAVLQKDIAVNTLVMPGEVFVIGYIVNLNYTTYPWWASENTDIDFGLANPWGEKLDANFIICRTNNVINDNIYMYKILSDSVKMGLKPVTDPDDFELIEVWGMGDGTPWIIGGVDKGTDWRAFRNGTYIRKPQYYQPRVNYKESFGTNQDDCEWYRIDNLYYAQLGTPEERDQWGWVTNDIGKHFMFEVTNYQSIVSSAVYKVSEGYSMNETIGGIKTGTSVNGFLALIIKKDENQTLTLKATANGAELTGAAVLSNNDTLVVVSANGENTTKYIIEVSDLGLNSDAVLTSTIYAINTAGAASVTGFDYGTTLQTVLDNLTVPLGATLTVIDKNGNYLSLKQLNFDTAYVDATVNDQTFFEVVAEDKTTSIIYQLLPNVTADAAFVLSSAYTVDQDQLLISLVPRGTEATVFLSYLIPSTGATLKLVDKLGVEKPDGPVVQDDRIIVTAADGVSQTLYYISMLATELIPESNYLAYVTSDEYTVDQLGMSITGPNASTPLTEFFGKLITSAGATMMVMDSEGLGQTEGNLDIGDVLMVTSADNSVSVMYELNLTVGVPGLLSKGEVVLFPNPFTGEFAINGLESGTRVKVFNQTGSVISDRIAQGDHERISLEGYRSGIYLVLITKQDKLIGTYKVVKQ